MTILRRGLTSRIKQLHHDISEITELGQFDRRVHVSGEDELGELEASVNTIIDAVDYGVEVDPKMTLFRHVTENIQEAIIVHGDDVIYVNPYAAARRGVGQRDLENKPFINLVHPGYRTIAQSRIAQRLAGETLPPLYELKMLDTEGNGYWVECADTLFEFEGKRVIVSALREISQRRRAQQAVRAAKDRAQVTLSSITDAVLTTGFEGRIDYLNDAAKQLLARPAEEIVGSQLLDVCSLVDETSRKPFADPVGVAMREGRSVSLGRKAMLLTSDGAEHFVEVTVSPMTLGDDQDPNSTHVDAQVGCVIVLHDVTELRGLAQQMSYQARHDALTGLSNRREFEHRLSKLIDRNRDQNSVHVVCYMDLDRFKAVNDTSGHAAGDNMLRQLSVIIRDKVRDSDLVARLGGDEFGMLLVGCPLEKARQIADDVCKAVRDFRFYWRDQVFSVGVSIGLVEVSHEAGTTEEVISAADSACYVAKQQGRSQVHVYSAKDEASARHKGEIAWLQLLQQALKEDGFVLYSQPIIPMDERKSIGPVSEILLRLRNERGALFEPAEFMEAAQRYHLMPAVDRWVVSNTLKAMGSEAIAMAPQSRCTINLSGQTLADAGFLEFVVECLDESGVSPTSICFEIKESSVITNMSQAQRFVAVLHGMGAEFALDDFGSGMGSFSNLKNLQLDYIKIDGEFCQNIATDKINQAMVSAIVKLARSLDIKVIAEEVDNKATLDTLRYIGVDYVQGFYMGKPAPI